MESILQQLDTLLTLQKNIEQLLYVFAFSLNGLQITSPKYFLWNIDTSQTPINIIPGSVSSIVDAPAGAIQDAAGGAIGQIPTPDIVSGVSQAIYAKFKGLRRISVMPENGVEFNKVIDDPNRTFDDSKRILHIHAVRLPGNPQNEADRLNVIDLLTTGYYNTISVFCRDKGRLPEKDRKILNLVPISGNIFAGAFKDPTLGHLHPSYTLVALYRAINKIKQNNVCNDGLPTINLYCYQENVAISAANIIRELNN